MTLSIPVETPHPSHRLPPQERPQPSEADRALALTGQGGVPDVAAVQAASAQGLAAVPFAPQAVPGPAVGRVEATEAYRGERDARR